MAALRSRRSERRSSSVWWRCGSDDRYDAASKSGARKSVRGSAAGKGSGASSSSVSEDEDDDGRANARELPRGRRADNERVVLVLYAMGGLYGR